MGPLSPSSSSVVVVVPVIVDPPFSSYSPFPSFFLGFATRVPGQPPPFTRVITSCFLFLPPPFLFCFLALSPSLEPPRIPFDLGEHGNNHHHIIFMHWLRICESPSLTLGTVIVSQHLATGSHSGD